MATDEPTDSPTDEPTKQPSHNPTTRDPTKMPSPHPTTAHPTRHPTTSDPTKHPSHNPTTVWPAKQPSHQPTTMDPTKRPSESPTTSDPTRRPTSGTYLAPEPTKKPTHSPKQAWKKAKPTWQKNDHESYEKEAVSHIYNPYDIRQRGIVKVQLEERIESDMQELSALNELESVSDEQQDSADVLLNENDEVREFDDFPFDDSADLNDEDYIGQIAPVYFFGCAGGIANGQSCSSACDCSEGCCEGGRCVAKKRDWANFLYCPADCRGKIFGSRGTC